ncbi:MAG: hypothetical protein AAF902_25465, partial [Chloroflexota bacterium]
MKINVSTKDILWTNLSVVVILLVANVLVFFLERYGNNDAFGQFRMIFDFDTEENVPTIYSTMALLLISIILSRIASMNRQSKLPYFPWLGLSIVFLFLAFDEFFQIHEAFINPVQSTLGVSGFRFYMWVIPYGIGLALLCILYLRFLYGLPSKTSFLFIVSGAIYVSGAIGFELISGRYVDLNGRDGAVFFVVNTILETLEMFGLALFTYALIGYIINQVSGLEVQIEQ